MTRLDLSKLPVTDGGLAAASFKTLIGLDLTGTKVTGAGVKHVLGSKGFTRLALDQKELLDDALAAR